jgi:hypothetical protein
LSPFNADKSSPNQTVSFCSFELASTAIWWDEAADAPQSGQRFFMGGSRGRPPHPQNLSSKLFVSFALFCG